MTLFTGKYWALIDTIEGLSAIGVSFSNEGYGCLI